MKKFLLLAGCVIVLMSFVVQSGADAIVNAFKSADATQVSNYLDDLCDIKLLDKDEVKNVGKNQASITLKTFFAENGVKGFEKTSDRVLGATMYLTGKLTGAGKTYNLTVMAKEKDGSPKIISIRIN
jgi:hypothetical protein